MLKAETTEKGIETWVQGRGITIFLEFSNLCANLLETGVPLGALKMAMNTGQKMANKEKSEDDKLAEEFMEELMKKVKEKHDAKQKN